MQTIYALCALVTASLLSFSVLRQHMQTSQGMIRNEVESLALAAATDQLDWAATLPFDGVLAATAPAQLTPAGAFGSAGGFGSAADLDDLHGARRMVDVETEEGPLQLDVTAAVRYMVRSGPGGAYLPSSIPTFVKELVVTVTGPTGARVRTSRLYPFRPGA